MASDGGAPAKSRLAQMQMRFQQKQVQEREQRRQELNGGAGGAATNSTMVDSANVAKNIGNGKVRQMFDERRRGAGIDRSHPLKPITTTSTVTKLSTTTNATNNNKRLSITPTVRSPTTMPTVSTIASKQQQVNNNKYRSDTQHRADSISRGTVLQNNNNKLDNELDGFKNTLGLNESKVSNSGDRNNNNDYKTRIKSSNEIKLNPVITKKSPPVSNSTRSPPTIRRTTPKSSTTSSALRSSNKTPEKTLRSNYATTPIKHDVNRMSGKVATDPAPPGTKTCRHCGRHFMDDRLARHEQICQKVTNSKRKIFDASKHRIKGTEAEKFVNKPGGRVPGPTYSSTAAVTGLKVEPKKNNWRKQHEEFISAIRSAKQVKAHLARGGKLSDLPPPPPSENPDYIQCPHCLRRFNQAAAERHIPKCATMLHNKPKPGAAQAPKRK